MRNERDLIGRWVAGLGLAALLSALAACAASPPVHFHSLMPIDTPVRTAASEAAVAVIVEPVRVPAQVDQPQWLIRMADGSVARLEQERWASPLRDELRGAVREWLVDRYGAVEATTPAASAAAVRIATELRRFESIPSSEARLEGSWALLVGGAAGTPGTSISCELLIREPVSGPGYAALAAAQRRAVERLVDAIGPSLRSFSRGESVSCPAKDAARP